MKAVFYHKHSISLQIDMSPIYTHPRITNINLPLPFLCKKEKLDQSNKTNIKEPPNLPVPIQDRKDESEDRDNCHETSLLDKVKS